ncbi:MAG: DUF4352 domain-containing protein [Anaerolineales bacterium]|nr:DUF4352 domain-containing protein [Anaerolineales bacterium]
MSDLLQQAIDAIRAKDKDTARTLFAQVVQSDPRNVRAWLWLASTLDDLDRRRECLERALALDPSNEIAMEQLEVIARRQQRAARTASVAMPRQRQKPMRSHQQHAKRPLSQRGWLLAVLVGAMVLILVIGCRWLAQMVAAPLAEWSQRGSAVSATAAPTGKWHVQYGQSPFDDSRTVVLTLRAEEEVQGWLTSDTPVLVLRCQEHEVDAYIDVGTQQDVEYGETDVSTVRVRFDHGTAQTLKMGQSTDGEALFFRNPASIIDVMTHHDQMVFGFTPFNAPPAQTYFDLRGLADAIKPLREVCGRQLLTPIPIPTSTPWPTEMPTPTPLPVGSTITINNWEIQVEKVLTTEALSLSDGYRSSAGRFVLVFILVTNHGSSIDSYPASDGLMVWDADGHGYHEDLVGTGYAQGEYNMDLGVNIAPGSSRQLVVAFDISEQSSYYVLGPGPFADRHAPSVLLDIP